MRGLDVTGERYGRLTALERVGTRHRQAVWRFRCECGVELDRLLGNVRQGDIRSCGCYSLESVADRSTTHGHTRGGKPSREWSSWKAMRDRCLRSGSINFSQYGGRGITICPQWVDSFETFLRDMGPRPADASLERKESNGHYTPDNCIWATSREQNRNKSNVVWTEDGGERLTIRDFAAKHGVNPSSLGCRMRDRGETAHEALAGLRSGGRLGRARRSA